jgi:hypothetical protein
MTPGKPCSLTSSFFSLFPSNTPRNICMCDCVLAGGYSRSRWLPRWADRGPALSGWGHRFRSLLPEWRAGPPTRCPIRAPRRRVPRRSPGFIWFLAGHAS